MNNAIIGYTGFVGGNLIKQYKFDLQYNSKNIEEIKGKEFNRLVISGVSAVKWLANKEPESDWKNISNLINCLQTVKAKEVILISTVDVYTQPIDVDESTILSRECGQPYGLHRLKFEDFVNQHFSNVFIIRLPGLFGDGLKKNIIFDFINNNGIDKIETRNIFQFYPLYTLSKDIQLMVDNKIKLLNMAVEPVTVVDVARVCLNKSYTNELSGPLIRYDFKSRYSKIWGGSNGYLYNKNHCLDALNKYIESCKK